MGTYDATYQHYFLTIPASAGTPGAATYLEDMGEEVLGIAVNGVLLDSHSQTWSYDMCNGHSDTKHQYHYHIPPFCLLNAMGVEQPAEFTWWANDAVTATLTFDEMAAAFAATGTPMLLGWALDGFPIYGPYDANGDLQQGASRDDSELDECNGKTLDGEYAYYVTPTPPFSPPCLRGEIGSFRFFSTDLKCPAAGINNTYYDAEEPVLDADDDDDDNGGDNNVDANSAAGAQVAALAVALAAVPMLC